MTEPCPHAETITEHTHTSALEPHPCPYWTREGYEETLCECCAECEDECFKDIARTSPTAAL